MSLFLNEDVKKLLYNKFVVIIGDSVHRGIYKDLIALLQGNSFLSTADLKTKGEESFMSDELLEGGTKGVMTNGVNYREVRQYKTDTHLVRFYFVTRVHNSYWRDVIFHDLSKDPQPDVVVMNSCLWDISRYGQSGMHHYKENLEKTFQTLAKIVPVECTCIWDTALPVASQIKGGFLLPELSSLSGTLRLDVLEGNYYARKIAAIFNIHVLDLNYFFRSLMGMQVSDGVHWNFKAHRRFTNLLLAHLAKIWNIKLPYRQEFDRMPCQEKKQKDHKTASKGFAKPAPKPPVVPQAIPTKITRWDVQPSKQTPTYTSNFQYNSGYSSFDKRYTPPPLNQPVLGNQPSNQQQTYHQMGVPQMGVPQMGVPAPSNPYVYRQYVGYGPQWCSQGPQQPVYPQQTCPQQQNASNQYNPYQCYSDAATRRYQRISAQRKHEIAGAMMNYLNTQYRVN